MPENDFWVLAVSPHPDDECLTGLLPLRLAEECGAKVAVWAASYGSAEERREERRRELRAACEFLGWKLLGRGTEGATVEGLAEWWRAHPGALVVCPHERDGHPRHRATHRLVRAAADMAGGRRVVAETDYWMPCERPNLLVEASAAHVERLAEALRKHAGEVARSDYDKRLGAWMCDNVRRAGEFMAGAGGKPPRFGFATPYRVRVRSGGRWRELAIRERAAGVGGEAMRWFAEDCRRGVGEG